MNEFILNVEIRWADLDPNAHVRHSVYYDWGALCRFEFFTLKGLTSSVMNELNFGPILFREEAVFRKEIRKGDRVSIDLMLLKARKDFSRWTIRHYLKKNDDVLCAVITVDGAWLDTVARKLAAALPILSDVFSNMPKDEKFEWTDR